jgi:NADP-dependent aldehyde dehydrogenase
MEWATISGKNRIGGRESSLGPGGHMAFNPIEHEAIEPVFTVATSAEIEKACSLAWEVFHTDVFGWNERAALLEKIAENIEAIGDPLLERAHAETALPLARLTGERGRTCAQLRMFATAIRNGEVAQETHIGADPDRQPMPRPELRRRLYPIGPVAVFGASNFPLAFSVAGGDTASALAAGCPVVVKAHPAHPGTSELVARAIDEAIKSLGLPAGLFSIVFGGAEVAAELVQHRFIKAVGFTGSKGAGRALFDLASRRPNPIPVFAEMGSVNPIFVLPGALQEREEALAAGYVQSLTMGVGQFCTNPGVLVVPDDATGDLLVEHIEQALMNVEACPMLTSEMAMRYEEGVSKLRHNLAIQPRFAPEGSSDGLVRPALFQASLADAIESLEAALNAKADAIHSDFLEEIFGPAGLVLRASSVDQMLKFAKLLPGQLTATVHSSKDGEAGLESLVSTLSRAVGRIVLNGFPTGVEVNAAMHHGGPYPASTDARFTSVGTAAIDRFLRPVAFQNIPESMIP